MPDPADLRAEGHREGVADGFLWLAAFVHAHGPVTQGKAGWLVGIAHRVRRGADLPDPKVPPTVEKPTKKKPPLRGVEER